MAYSFQYDEDIGTGFKRIAYDQIDRAIQSLKENEDRLEGIHDFRKRMKKLRGLLRLVRSSIGEENYQQENTAFRDLARKFSVLRDTTIFQEKLAKLKENGISTDASDQIQQAIDQSKHHQNQEMDRLFADSTVVDDVVAELNNAKARIGTCEIPDEFGESIFPNLKRTYKRGQDALDTARHTENDDDLHEWRKRVKYLWYHIRLLKNMWPGLLKPLAEEIHQLSRNLGDDHDYAVLTQEIKQERLTFSSDETKRAVLNQINEARREIQDQSYPLGEKIYAEKAKQFAKRMATYWQTWRKEEIKPESSASFAAGEERMADA